VYRLVSYQRAFAFRGSHWRSQTHDTQWPFLKTVTDSEWAEDLREQLQRAVTGAIRSQMRRARDAGDLKRALLLANQLLRVDPYDPEVLVERVEVARGVASPQEIARYVVEMQRMGS
jgi:citrate lyase beta subunit